jgi:hypothetical protein
MGLIKKIYVKDNNMNKIVILLSRVKDYFIHIIIFGISQF